MRILQLDANEVEYELVKPEAKVYEETTEKKVSVRNALLLLTSIEKGDDKEIVEKAVAAATDFAKKQKIETIIIYPFAHLSSNLEAPVAALEILKEMRKTAEGKGVKVVSSPFGWNKKLKVDIKGHPLAEMSRSYSSVAAPQRIAEKKPIKIDTAIVKKSDWSGLPAADHRTIGEQLDLYSFQEVSPGMVYWHPKGYIIFREIQKLLREKLDAYGYQEVKTPVLANTALWYVSGHIDHYRDNMYILESDGQEIGLKPMSCPFHILIYKTKTWSYREFPYRLAEFGMVHRNEISGALTGLFRVRQITQDDAHLFVREDQIESEISKTIRFALEFYKVFGMKSKLYLSTMPDDHMGDEKFWEKATNTLKRALVENNVEYGIKDKEGAFYAPKIDGDIVDSMGRSWQLLTIQADYQMPKKFNLEYVGEDGKRYQPVIIHRAIAGSLERFVGVLVEHYQGKFPTWLAPVQVRVMSISDLSADYAEGIYDEMLKAGIRVELDTGNRTIDYKVRDAQMIKVPYMVIVGQKEIDAKTIAVRTRSGKQSFGVDPKIFAKELIKEVEKRTDALLYQK